MAKRKRIYEEQEMNLTPLIDCVFLLLIFFMVTTVFKQPYSLQVELPEARHAKQVEEKKLVGTITVDGRMEINREPVNEGNLEQVVVAGEAGDRESDLDSADGQGDQAQVGAVRVGSGQASRGRNRPARHGG